MRVTDRLIEDAKRKEKNRKKVLEEEEETLLYSPRKMVQHLNRESGVFESGMNEGINTRKSVFNETAVFRVEDNER